MAALIEINRPLMYISFTLEAIIDMKTISILITICCVSISLSQEHKQKNWIYFTHKDYSAAADNRTQADLAAQLGISERAMKRRAKVSQTIGPEDLPVSNAMIQQLTERGFEIIQSSRWLNAVSVYTSDSEREWIMSQPFVRTIEPVVLLKRDPLPDMRSEQYQFSKQTSNKFSYGFSETQMKLINAVAVHNIGISGRGVLVGMLDTGFRWKTHESMQKLNVIAEYDFIQKDSVTANQTGDSGNQDSHGTSVMSLVGGFKEGTLVSPAFNAQFILGKTEYVPSETNIEEDHWVAGIEWMEAQGADIVSSSLGYSEFDAGQKSYTYADMNGKTATTTKAASIAMRKGVVVVNAMGNEANGSWKYMISPADADSILSIGAVASNGVVASFSSIGPTSDGRMKPDVSAQGVSVYAAVPSGSYTSGFGGTSAATPFVAGVAAMLLSARPELTPVQVRDALRTTANNSSSPNNSIGWGIINAYDALLHHGMVIGTDPEIVLTQDSNYSIGIFVVSKAAVYKDSVRVFYTNDNGSTFQSVPMTLSVITDTSTHSGKYSAVIPKNGSVPKFYIRAVDAAKSPRTSPFAAPAELYDAASGTTGIRPSGSLPSQYVLRQNFPNPFNPSTSIVYELPRAGHVELTVYDILGRKVAMLVNEQQPPNVYTVPFSGVSLSSGVYLYQLKTADYNETKRMMLVK